MGEIRYLPSAGGLTPEQRRYWSGQAAYWGERQEEAERAMNYAVKQRDTALQMLGMLAIGGGTDNEPA